MEKNDRPISREEIQINKLLDDTMKDVAKLENDLSKLPSRPPMQLNYTPPGMQDLSAKQIRQDKEIIKSQIGVLKDSTIIKTNEITAHLPQDQQKKFERNAIDKLYPNATSQQKELVENKHKTISIEDKVLIAEKSENITKDIKTKEALRSPNKEATVSKFMKEDISSPQKITTEKDTSGSRSDSKLSHSKFFDTQGVPKKEPDKNISKAINDRAGKEDR